MRPEFLAMRIIGVVLLVMTGLTGASLAASFSPPQATDQYEHAFSNIQLQPDPRIFAVMVALNAAGFSSDDSSSGTMSKARVLFREHAENLAPEIVATIESFIARVTSPEAPPPVRTVPAVTDVMSPLAS